MHQFEICNKWSVQANKQTDKQAYRHTCAMQSTSVELTQAHPNKVMAQEMVFQHTSMQLDWVKP